MAEYENEVSEEHVRVVKPGVTTVDTKWLNKKYQALKTSRSNVQQVWEQLERYFMPMGSGATPYVTMTEGMVRWRRQEVWDSTAIDAAAKLAASIHGSVTSPAIRWFKLQWREEELKNNSEARAFLEALGDSVFDTLQDSDFNSEIASADHDLVVYGNCFIVEEPASSKKWEGVDFTAIPIRECYVESDSHGGIETFYRRLSWTNQQIYDRWGDASPKDVIEKCHAGTALDERHELVFCVFEREEMEKNANKFPLAPHLRPIGSVYFRASDGKRLGDEDGYYEMPVCHARWAKTSGSVWGHGPCNTLLPTVRGLNAWRETYQNAAAKTVDPATLVTERGLLSDLDLEPGGLTVVRSLEDVKVHESGARFDVSDNLIQQERAAIHRGLHIDDLQLKDSPAMTATEVQARYELMNRVLGSTLSRIETDLLSPVVMITVGHLYRAGQMPPMPDVVKQKFGEGGADFNIEYQGPLSRAQRTDEVAAIERVLSAAAALLQMGVPLPVVMAKLDLIKAIGEIAKRLGAPAAMVRPDEEAYQALNAVIGAQAEAQKAATQKTQNEAALAAASARATAAPPGSGLPVPASPTPVVSPAYGMVG